MLTQLGTLLFIVLPLHASTVLAQDTSGPTHRKVDYSPSPEETFPHQVCFGDTHLHAWYLADAGMVGATTTPEDAYRFARGEIATDHLN